MADMSWDLGEICALPKRQVQDTCVLWVIQNSAGYQCSGN